ncbi:hypothetical protein L4D09_09155 [Photobacterium makurazakiensis]|uniref:hypothetical protein n=1 Tax=Photobacterium makurazakiensis TaxID=2910234 RepID=UPI003D0D7E9F
MRVNFNIFKGNVSWNALIHQLNSDVLLRQVLIKGHVDSHNVNFSYCEKTCEGRIVNGDNEIIGNFSIPL